jgi:hypothetical protein
MSKSKAIFPFQIIDNPPFIRANVFSFKANHVIRDRKANSSVIEEICGRETNLDIVAHHMRTAGVRAGVSAFFINGSVAKVISAASPIQAYKIGEAVTTRDELIKLINSSCNMQEVASVVSEFVIPFAFKIGLINEQTVMTTNIVYPAGDPTISDFALDLVGQNAVRITETINISFKGEGKMSKDAFARLVAESLQVIGYELHRGVNTQHLFEDIVKAIHVNMTSGFDPTYLGAIEDEWLTHPVVKELSTNATFLKAARDIVVGSSVATKNDIHTLLKDAPLALASLLGSRRYQVISADEYLSSYGKLTLKDVTGRPLYFVGWRAAEMKPVAQNISVFKDIQLPNLASNIVPGPEGVSSFIAQSSPSGEAAGVNYHVGKYCEMLQHVIESADPRASYYNTDEGSPFQGNIGETFVHGDDGQSFSETVAMLMADSIMLVRKERDVIVKGKTVLDDNGDPVVELTGYEFMFSKATKYRDFVDPSYHLSLDAAGVFYTTDVGVLLLVCDDFAPKTQIEPRSQLLAEKAMYTRLIGLDVPSRLVKGKNRIAFNLNLGNMKVSGKLMTSDVGMQEMHDDSYFVIPVYNQRVAIVINDIHDSMNALVKQVEMMATTPLSDEFVGAPVVTAGYTQFLGHARARALMEMARSVSPQYRKAVTSLMRMRALASSSAKEAQAARGALYQQQFLGFADVMALATILATNGLPHQFVLDSFSSKNMSELIMLYGSDRVEAKRI